ncbi:MAG: HTH domain-containing protein [Frisingicoccus sp.]
MSGQELCEYFQVSRTAVWKVIGQLKSEGYEIEAINRKVIALSPVRTYLRKLRF